MQLKSKKEREIYNCIFNYFVFINSFFFFFSNRGALEEADPSITFRGHTNIVTSIAISSAQNRIYSASLDSTIRLWRLPDEERGPFSPVGKVLVILCVCVCVY